MPSRYYKEESKMSLRDELRRTANDLVSKREKEREEYLKKKCEAAARSGEFYIELEEHTFGDGTKLERNDVKTFAMLHDLEYQERGTTEDGIPYIAFLSWK